MIFLSKMVVVLRLLTRWPSREKNYPSKITINYFKTICITSRFIVQAEASAKEYRLCWILNIFSLGLNLSFLPFCIVKEIYEQVTIGPFKNDDCRTSKKITKLVMCVESRKKEMMSFWKWSSIVVMKNQTRIMIMFVPVRLQRL